MKFSTFLISVLVATQSSFSVLSSAVEAPVLIVLGPHFTATKHCIFNETLSKGAIINSIKGEPLFTLPSCEGLYVSRSIEKYPVYVSYPTEGNPDPITFIGSFPLFSKQIVASENPGPSPFNVTQAFQCLGQPLDDVNNNKLCDFVCNPIYINRQPGEHVCRGDERYCSSNTCHVGDVSPANICNCSSVWITTQTFLNSNFLPPLPVKLLGVARVVEITSKPVIRPLISFFTIPGTTIRVPMIASASTPDPDKLPLRFIPSIVDQELRISVMPSDDSGKTVSTRLFLFARKTGFENVDTFSITNGVGFSHIALNPVMFTTSGELLIKILGPNNQASYEGTLWIVGISYCRQAQCWYCDEKVQEFKCSPTENKIFVIAVLVLVLGLLCYCCGFFAFKILAILWACVLLLAETCKCCNQGGRACLRGIQAKGAYYAGRYRAIKSGEPIASEEELAGLTEGLPEDEPTLRRRTSSADESRLERGGYNGAVQMQPVSRPSDIRVGPVVAPKIFVAPPVIPKIATTSRTGFTTPAFGSMKKMQQAPAPVSRSMFNVNLSICLITLVGLCGSLGSTDAEGCIAGFLQSQSIEQCVVDGQKGTRTCQTSFQINGKIPTAGGTVCMHLQDTEKNIHLGSIQVTYTQLLMHTTLLKSYYTSDWEARLWVDLWCPRHDPCRGDFCSANGYTNWNGNWNNDWHFWGPDEIYARFPGVYNCYPGCGHGASCGCFFVEDGCLVTKWVVLPKTDTTVEVRVPKGELYLPYVKIVILDDSVGGNSTQYGRSTVLYDGLVPYGQEFSLGGLNSELGDGARIDHDYNVRTGHAVIPRLDLPVFKFQLIGVYSAQGDHTWGNDVIIISDPQTAHIGTAAVAGQKTVDTVGDIQGNTRESLFEPFDGFDFAKDICKVSQDGKTATLPCRVPGIRNVFSEGGAYRKFPVQDGNVYSWFQHDQLISRMSLPGGIEFVLSTNHTYGFVQEISVVCPHAKFLSGSGWAGRADGVVLRISTWSSCQSGMVILKSDSDLVQLATGALSLKTLPVGTQEPIVNVNDKEYIYSVNLQTQRPGKVSFNLILANGDHSTSIPCEFIAQDFITVRNDTTISGGVTNPGNTDSGTDDFFDSIGKFFDSFGSLFSLSKIGGVFMFIMFFCLFIFVIYFVAMCLPGCCSSFSNKVDNVKLKWKEAGDKRKADKEVEKAKKEETDKSK